jgi:G3E family GTPase
MVNLDIITGFLGAGKTTLINTLLAGAYAGENTIVIENEFGDVSIDDSLIEDKETQVRTLSSGCICCTLKGDFIESITEVVKHYAPERIIIEPTGLADPVDILSACELAGTAVPLRINAHITAANAKNLLPVLTVGGAVFRKQIYGANFLLLNRTKLLNPDRLTETINKIRELNPNCAIVDQDRRRLDALSILTLAEDAFESSPACREQHCQHDHDDDHEHHHHHHEDGIEEISSLAFFPEKSFSPEELTELFTAFAGGIHGRILRAKGFLKNTEGKFAHLEYVYKQGELLDSGYAGPPKFVVIGLGLDEAGLSRLMGGGA